MAKTRGRGRSGNVEDRRGQRGKMAVDKMDPGWNEVVYDNTPILELAKYYDRMVDKNAAADPLTMMRADNTPGAKTAIARVLANQSGKPKMNFSPVTGDLPNFMGFDGLMGGIHVPEKIDYQVPNRGVAAPRRLNAFGYQPVSTDPIGDIISGAEGAPSLHGGASADSFADALNTDIASRMVSDLMRDFDLTQQQAIGVVGPLAMESHGFETLNEMHPTSPDDPSFGYAQWKGPRKAGFNAFVEETGLDPSSYEANYGFIKHELLNAPADSGNALRKIREADTAPEVAKVFTEAYLRPGKPNMTARLDWTEAVGNTFTPTPGADIVEASAPQVDNSPVSIIDLMNGEQIGGRTFKNTHSRARGDVPVEGIVFHHTAGSTLSSALDASVNNGSGAQYYIDTDGKIYRWAGTDQIMEGIRGPNDSSRTDAGEVTAGLDDNNIINVEVVAPDSKHMNQAQRDAARSLVGEISNELGYTPKYIVGHGQIQGSKPNGNKQADEGVDIAAYASEGYNLGQPVAPVQNDALDAIRTMTADGSEQYTVPGINVPDLSAFAPGAASDLPPKITVPDVRARPEVIGSMPGAPPITGGSGTDALASTPLRDRLHISDFPARPGMPGSMPAARPVAPVAEPVPQAVNVPSQSGITVPNRQDLAALMDPRPMTAAPARFPVPDRVASGQQFKTSSALTPEMLADTVPSDLVPPEPGAVAFGDRLVDPRRMDGGFNQKFTPPPDEDPLVKTLRTRAERVANQKADLTIDQNYRLGDMMAPDTSASAHGFTKPEDESDLEATLRNRAERIVAGKTSSGDNVASQRAEQLAEGNRTKESPDDIILTKGGVPVRRGDLTPASPAPTGLNPAEEIIKHAQTTLDAAGPIIVPDMTPMTKGKGTKTTFPDYNAAFRPAVYHDSKLPKTTPKSKPDPAPGFTADLPDVLTNPPRILQRYGQANVDNFARDAAGQPLVSHPLLGALAALFGGSFGGDQNQVASALSTQQPGNPSITTPGGDTFHYGADEPIPEITKMLIEHSLGSR